MTIQTGTYARMIGNAFRLGDMTPGLEAAIGREMLAAQRRERKRPETPQNGYHKQDYTAGYDVARDTVLRLLEDGPVYSADMMAHVSLTRGQLYRLLSAMSRDWLITCERPDNGKAALWRLP